MEKGEPLSDPAKNLRRRAEDKIRTGGDPPGEAARKEILADAERERLIHELQVHEVELELQNDELRRTQHELGKSHARYLELYDFSPVAYLTLREDGQILEANLTATVLLDLERTSLLQRPFSHFILPADHDLFNRHRKALFAGGDPQSGEIRMLKSDGTPFWALIRSVAAAGEDRSFLCHVVVADITGRKRSEEAIRSTLAEKDVLLRELTHRTKNNMQVIGSLLNLQSAAMRDPRFTEALKETQDRIRAMALVHEKLSRSADFSSPDMKEYVTELFTSLLRAHHGACGPVTPELDVEEIPVCIEAAVPIGLIINELVSNSLKHAFPPGKAGTIAISLRRNGEETELRYRDDGPGLPRDFDLSRVPSLGLKLVYNLAVRQLRGKFEIRRDPGTEFIFTFGNLAHKEANQP